MKDLFSSKKGVITFVTLLGCFGLIALQIAVEIIIIQTEWLIGLIDSTLLSYGIGQGLADKGKNGSILIDKNPFSSKKFSIAFMALCGTFLIVAIENIFNSYPVPQVWIMSMFATTIGGYLIGQGLADTGKWGAK